MFSRKKLMVVAAASLASAALILPTSGLAAHDGWHGVWNGEPQIIGSGRLATENRPIGNFRAIELRGMGDAEVRLGTRPSLQITADDNLLRFFSTQVEGDTLVIDSRGSFRTQSAPRIVITAPNVDRVVTKGSGDVRLSGVNNSELSLITRGSGDITAQGRTRSLHVRIQGSGDTDVRSLRTDSADASIQGSGDIRVTTDGALNASVAGSGTIFYAGNPRPLRIRTAGSGSVVAAN